MKRRRRSRDNRSTLNLIQNGFLRLRGHDVKMHERGPQAYISIVEAEVVPHGAGRKVESNIDRYRSAIDRSRPDRSADKPRYQPRQSSVPAGLTPRSMVDCVLDGVEGPTKSRCWGFNARRGFRVQWRLFSEKRDQGASLLFGKRPDLSALVLLVSHYDCDSVVLKCDEIVAREKGEKCRLEARLSGAYT